MDAVALELIDLTRVPNEVLHRFMTLTGCARRQLLRRSNRFVP